MTARKLVSIRLNPTLWDRARHAAIDRHITVAELVELALDHELAFPLGRAVVIDEVAPLPEPVNRAFLPENRGKSLRDLSYESE